MWEDGGGKRCMFGRGVDVKKRGLGLCRVRREKRKEAKVLQKKVEVD
jgi:hypothetical protein